MRRCIFFIVAIFMMCTMHAAALTPSFQLCIDETGADEDENIYVTVCLTETIEGKFRNVQGQLKYDAEEVSYVSHQLSEAYSDYVALDMEAKGWFSFSYTEFAEEGFSKLPKDEVVTIVFQPKNGQLQKADDTEFLLEVDVQDTSGMSEKMSDSLKVNLQNKPYAATEDDTEGTASGEMDRQEGKETLDEHEESYSGESKEKDFDDQSTDDAATGGEVHEERANPEWSILAIGIGGIGLLTYIIYRAWKRKKERTA